MTPENTKLFVIKILATDKIIANDIFEIADSIIIGYRNSIGSYKSKNRVSSNIFVFTTKSSANQFAAYFQAKVAVRFEHTKTLINLSEFTPIEYEVFQKDLFQKGYQYSILGINFQGAKHEYSNRGMDFSDYLEKYPSLMLEVENMNEDTNLVSDILSDLSILYRMQGGSGINFTPVRIKELEMSEV